MDLFAEALKLKAEADHGEEDEDEEEGAEPEDDFNAAWEVLDLARAIYDKGKDDSDEVKLKLADTYITLGDISLETGILLYYHFSVTRIDHHYRKIRPGDFGLRSWSQAQA